MRDLLLILSVAASLPIAFARPQFGLLVWAWLGYMNPHRLVWGFAYSLPFVQVVAIVTLLGLIFRVNDWQFRWTKITSTWLLFVIWMCVTTLTALHPAGASFEWGRTIKIQLMVLVTILIMNTERRIKALVFVIAMSIAFFGVKGGWFTLATGGKYLVWGPADSFIEGNNELAFALVVTLPLLWFLHSLAPNKLTRWATVLAIVLCIFSIAGSYSRGAFLAGSAMLIFLWLKSRKKLITGVLVTIAAGVTLAFMPGQWFDRMETIQNYEQDRSAMGRINAWRFAVNLANDHPVTGGGFDVFTPELFAVYAPEPENVHDAHSIFFEVLAEHGYIGLCLYLCLGLFTFGSAGAISRKSRQYPALRWCGDLAAMIQVALVGYVVGGMFLGLAYFDLLYHLMAIVVLLEGIITNSGANPRHRAGSEKSINALNGISVVATPLLDGGSRSKQE